MIAARFLHKLVTSHFINHLVTLQTPVLNIVLVSHICHTPSAQAFLVLKWMLPLAIWSFHSSFLRVCYPTDHIWHVHCHHNCNTENGAAHRLLCAHTERQRTIGSPKETPDSHTLFA